MINFGDAERDRQRLRRNVGICVIPLFKSQTEQLHVPALDLRANKPDGKRFSLVFCAFWIEMNFQLAA